MPLRPVFLDSSILEQPLPWDLYTVSGVLVASAGTTLSDKELLAKLTARPLFRQSDGKDGEADLGERVHLLMQDFPTLFKTAGTTQLEPLIRTFARELIALVHIDHDACLGLLRLLPMPAPAARHCLLSATVVLDMIEQTLALENPLVESTVCATLTMNVAAMRLHSDLADRQIAIDAEQRDSISRHPQDSLKLLEVSGVQDRNWLAAVAQHHENLDGSGYPNSLRGEEILRIARSIRIADFYVAKIRGRRYRQAVSTRSAFKHIFGDERNRLDSQLALLLLRRLGLFPPGTLVRLSSREIAVVARKQGSSETAGNVIAFLGPSGKLLKTPVERNTTQVNYTILNIAEIEPSWPEIRWETFWGY